MDSMSLHFHSISNVFDDFKFHHHGQFQIVNEKNAWIVRSTSKLEEWEFKSGVSISFHTISVCIFFFLNEFHSFSVILSSLDRVVRPFFLSNGTHEWTMAPLEYFHFLRSAHFFSNFVWTLCRAWHSISLASCVVFVAYYLCRLRLMLLRMFLLLFFLAK